MSKVLVVDDIAENIQIIAMALSNDYEVLFATNGFDAIDIAKQELPDIIILDIMMPELNGYDVCRELKQIESTEDIPIIFVTAINEEDSELLGLSLGAIDYITKPISPKLLQARIKNYLKLQKTQNELTKLNAQLEDRVNDEVSRRISSEQFLIQQSRLASMGEMIGIITHQWKQPLNIIALLIQSVRDAKDYNELDDEKIDEIESEVLKQVDFMSTTINDFKNFFSPSKEKIQFDVNESLAVVKRLLKAQFDKLNITVIVKNSGSYMAVGFKNEFRQAMFNILSNAKDAFLERKILEPIISISILDSIDSIIIEIEDNGGGIDETLLPTKLFDSYTSTKGLNGTGIGLHIVKMIIEENMSGKIEAENINDGAKFTIRLPKINKG